MIQLIFNQEIKSFDFLKKDINNQDECDAQMLFFR